MDEDDRFAALELKIDLNAQKLDAVLEALARVGGGARPQPPRRPSNVPARLTPVDELASSARGSGVGAGPEADAGSLKTCRANSVDDSDTGEPETAKAAAVEPFNDDDVISEKPMVLEDSDAWMLNPKNR